MDARTENELAMLLDGLRLYDDTGCFTRFLAALVDHGCPVEAIVLAFRDAYGEEEGEKR